MKDYVRLEYLKNGTLLFNECIAEIEDRICNKKCRACTFNGDALYVETYDREGTWRVFRLFERHPYDWHEYGADTYAYATDDAVELWRDLDPDQVYELVSNWRKETKNDVPSHLFQH